MAKRPTKPKRAAPRVGRPPLPLDEATVGRLAFEGASNVEIALELGCDDQTIINRFSKTLAKKRAERRRALRNAQWAAALAGNATLLIWLGKQELDQSDSPAPAGAAAKDPIEEIAARGQGKT